MTSAPDRWPATRRSLRDLLIGEQQPLAHVVALGEGLIGQLERLRDRGELPHRLAPEDILIEDETTHAVLLVPSASGAPPSGYASPEVARGDAPDERSAVWQVGVLLFELLTGSALEPHDGAGGESHAALPSLTATRADIPDQLACAIYRMLDTDPDLRLQSLDEAREALSPHAVRRGPLPGDSPPSTSFTWAVPFVGRTAEMSRVRQILTDSPARLLTVLGPGGIGKSRLAFHAAQTLAETFVDGVCIVPLGAVQSPAFIPLAIGNALDFAFYGRRDPVEQLTGFLEGKNLLLVLDDFDRLIEGADLIATLLHHANGPRIMITSRSRLNLSEETVLTIEGLSVPPDADSPDAAGYAAVMLFREHVRRIGAASLVSELDLPFVARICQLLDGVPLGIEQAASWARTLSCGAIADEIAHDIDFVATTVRDVPEQHRSMRAVFERSWRLLEPAYREPLARTAVCPGGFRRDTAEAVAGLSLTSLGQLIDRSLIQRAGPYRYRLHELLRHFLLEKLAEQQGEPGRTRARHAEWLAAFLDTEDRGIRGGDPESLARVDAESANINATMEWALRSGEIHVVERILDPLCTFLSVRGWHRLGDRLCGDAIPLLRGMPPDPAHRRLLARCLSWQASFQFRLGTRAGTRALLEESRGIQTETGAIRDLAFTLRHLALVAHSQGNSDEATAFAEEALALCQSSGDQRMKAFVLGDMGIRAQAAGDYRAARQLYGESLALHRSDGTVTGVISSLTGLGTICRSYGEESPARDYFEESRSLSRQSGNRRSEVFATMNLSNLAQDRGENEQALALVTEALGIAREISQPDTVAMCLCVMGNVYCELARLSEAQRVLEESLAIRVKLGATQEAAVSRTCLADVLYLAGEFHRAGGLYAESLRVFERDNNRWGLVSSLRGLCDAHMARGDLTAATAAGERMLAILRGTSDRPHCAQALESWVGVLLARGDHRRAAELWGCVSGYLTTARAGSGWWQGVRRELEEALSTAELEEAIGGGGRTSPEEMVDRLAVEECGS
ncbi:MAG: tetratricopeptide repeat protein [Candidatus Eisenbacteria bacterium]|nr:tetratricopeptide repeat protein [Candidatus Eisenbacteria bacterium]